MRIIQVTLGWIVGVIIYEFFSSIFQNEGMDWGSIFTFSVGGFIGVLIGVGLWNAFKNNKSV